MPSANVAPVHANWCNDASNILAIFSPYASGESWQSGYGGAHAASRLPPVHSRVVRSYE